ncbi:hypothetical protein A3J34_03795 [Candidatus Peribacteria bacterium RIFCSPLOWO2_02_FULL_51_10]|nr:MAG: hypothetical protein A3C52_01655 [Candidatus Peribacteria bacterium RIFCSPHIGHO2_02_FULL_51_15]OGJ68148.1 MAG: hypothetical protein A3J34_03795 [Candidatus Peribacteria bacterium RIFCSPLOWO2_02_FULL_51_10]
MKRLIVIIVALVAAGASGYFVYTSLNDRIPAWLIPTPESASDLDATEYDQNSSVSSAAPDPVYYFSSSSSGSFVSDDSSSISSSMKSRKTILDE